jgi:hypothetical protein
MESSRLRRNEKGQPHKLKEYQALVGNLMYAMIGTRADIAFATGCLCRYMANPSKEHMTAAYRVLRYLLQTIDYGIVFGGDDMDLHGYTDSDHASDPDTRRSTAGYVFLMFGGIISWKSKLQATVCMSSTESEYMALGEATKEALWLRQLKAGLEGDPRTITIFIDNQGALDLSKNPKHHSRTKHIEVRHHFVREHLVNGDVTFLYCPTEYMWADTMTKPLAKNKFVACREGMGVRKIEA